METVERLAFLLLVAAIVAMLARRIRLPYTVGLTLVGILFAVLPGGFTIDLTKSLIFSAFLPPLIFEASHQMDWKSLRRELAVVSTLATIGVLLSAALMAVGAHYLLHWSWPACILIGVLLSATDPVAVIATFRDLKLSGRIRMQIESESLFNDGTVAVLFTIALAVFRGGEVHAMPVLSEFLVMVLGGAACGAAVAAVTLFLAGRTDDHLVEITFTTIAAYGSFLVAEHLHCSGVLATMTAGIVLGNTGSLGAVSDKGREAIESFWEYLGYLANSLIFILIGMALGKLSFAALWPAVPAIILLMLAGRALAIYSCCLPFSRSRNRVPLANQHLLFWGGLRGALALALALGLPDDLPGRAEILAVVFGAVAFSVIAQGVTVSPLMKALRIAGEGSPV